MQAALPQRLHDVVGHGFKQLDLALIHGARLDVEQAAPKQLPVWADLVSEVAIRLRRVPDEKLAAIVRNNDEAGTLPIAHEERRKTNPRRRTQVLVDPTKALTDGKGVVLVEVEGVGESRARAIKDGLARLAESSILERYV